MRILEAFERIMFLEFVKANFPGWSTDPKIYEASRKAWEVELKKREQERRRYEYI